MVYYSVKLLILKIHLYHKTPLLAKAFLNPLSLKGDIAYLNRTINEERMLDKILTRGTSKPAYSSYL